MIRVNYMALTASCFSPSKFLKATFQAFNYWSLHCGYMYMKNTVTKMTPELLLVETEENDILKQLLNIQHSHSHWQTSTFYK